MKKNLKPKPAPFAVGDSVQLKSGGPMMTVCKCTENYVCCLWFSGGGLQRADFEKDTIFRQGQAA